MKKRSLYYEFSNLCVIITSYKKRGFTVFVIKITFIFLKDIMSKYYYVSSITDKNVILYLNKNILKIRTNC